MTQKTADSYQTKIAQTLSASIASGATKSEAINIGGCTLGGIIFPSTMTGSTVTFEVSNDGVTFYPFKNSAGTSVSVTVSVSSWIGLSVADFSCVQYIKVVSGSTEGALRQISLIAKNV